MLLLEREVDSLNLLLSEAAKARNELAGLAEERGQQARTLEARSGLLKNASILLKQNMLTRCDIELVFAGIHTPEKILTVYSIGWNEKFLSSMPTFDTMSNNR